MEGPCQNRPSQISYLTSLLSALILGAANPLPHPDDLLLSGNRFLPIVLSTVQ